MNKLKENIEDVQNTPDKRHLDIDKVGIKSIRHPISVKDKTGGDQSTIAMFDMYVHLPHNFKGTHMSRFVEILNENEKTISVQNFEKILRDMLHRLESEAGDVEMTFPYFINKKAPVSEVESLLDYEVTFIGSIKENIFTNQIKVVVPVTSLCPCSKKISDYGAHNQRSHVTVTVKTPRRSAALSWRPARAPSSLRAAVLGYHTSLQCMHPLQRRRRCLRRRRGRRWPQKRAWPGIGTSIG